jgi:hypothetical protein
VRARIAAIHQKHHIESSRKNASICESSAAGKFDNFGKILAKKAKTLAKKAKFLAKKARILAKKAKILTNLAKIFRELA